MVDTTNTSAGVYTSRTDLSTGVTNLAPTVVGCCGMARKGPINARVPVRTPEAIREIFGLRDPKYGMGLYTAEPITMQTYGFHYVRLVNKAKYAVVVLTVDDPTAPVPIMRLTPYVVDGKPEGVEDLGVLGFTPDGFMNSNVLGYFRMENPGDWNNQMAMSIGPANPLGLDPVADQHLYDAREFKLNIFENYTAASNPVESHKCTYVSKVDEFSVQMDVSDKTKDSANIRFIKNEYFSHPEIKFLTSDFVYFQGGSDGEKVTEDQAAAAYLKYFGDPEEFRVTLLVPGTQESFILHRAMQQAASGHINCHVVGSIPTEHQSTNKAIRYRKNILNVNQPNISLYSPDVKIFDEDTGRTFFVPCTGHVAAAYALTDNERGQWFAPAGIRASRFLKILGTKTKYDDDDRQSLAREQINYIRKLPRNMGYAIWEAFTLYNRNSAFQQVPIQRMVSHILEACSISSRIGLFDPNDQVLRDRLTGMIEDFLEDIKLRRGLRGGDSQGYVVVCNENNNTNQTIANGDLIIDLVLDPTRTTRRLIYRFNINPKGSRVTTV